MAVALLATSCDFDVKKVNPRFLDTQRGYARVYKAIKIDKPQCGKPNYEFVYTGTTQPIASMNGYVCLPTNEAQEIIKYFNEETIDQCKTLLKTERMFNSERL